VLKSVQNKFLPPPSLLAGSDRDLSIDSTLEELPRYDFSVSPKCRGIKVARVFEKYPLLPGVILFEEGEFLGMISRRQLLECLLHPQGVELFLPQPLSSLYSYARTETLILPQSTPILAATQSALRRRPELLAEPVVVQTTSGTYQLLDVQQLHLAAWQIRGIETQIRYERIQTQMVQSEKMASLGRLVDGVAHEILDPVGFIWGNLTYISSYSQQILELLAVYEKLLPQPSDEIRSIKEEIEIEFLQTDLPQAIASVEAGAERLKKLGTSLQNFCHIDEVYPRPADLNSCLDNIILLLKSRLNSEIKVVKNYGHLPPVSCFLGQLSQVFMNILSNAVDAVITYAVRQNFATQSSASAHNPCIEITTEVRSGETINPSIPYTRWVSIRIADNGSGLSPQAQQQIIESFSTKKRAEKETSLSVSYWIITARHGGQLKLRSTPIELRDSPSDMGTEFEILLPLI
jgi:hypothetical protein